MSQVFLSFSCFFLTEETIASVKEHEGEEERAKSGKEIDRQAVEMEKETCSAGDSALLFCVKKRVGEIPLSEDRFDFRR